MQRLITAALIISALMVPAQTALAALTQDGAPLLLPPQAAKAAAEATVAQPPMPPARVVSQQQAAAAAHIPGAVTEGSPFATVPIRALAGVRRLMQASTTLTTSCWFRALGYTWGGWPYNKKVTDNTYWCGNGSDLTYRSTNVTTDSYLCLAHNPYQYKTSGGVGTSGVEIVVGSYFDCPTAVPWITYHYNQWHHDAFAAYGSSAIIWVS